MHHPKRIREHLELDLDLNLKVFRLSYLQAELHQPNLSRRLLMNFHLHHVNTLVMVEPQQLLDDDNVFEEDFVDRLDDIVIVLVDFHVIEDRPMIVELVVVDIRLILDTLKQRRRKSIRKNLVFFFFSNSYEAEHSIECFHLIGVLEVLTVVFAVVVATKYT